MLKIGRNRVARVVFLLCCALAVGSVSSGVPAAQAGPLESLPGPVREVTEAVEEVAGGVVPPVTEVTETVAPPVSEVTEKVPSPVKEVTETVAPPVAEVTEKVPPPVKEVTENTTHATHEAAAKVLPPAAKTPTKPPSVSTVDPSEATKTVTHGAEEAVRAVTGSTRNGRSPAGAGPVGAGDARGGLPRSASMPSGAGRVGSTAKATGDGDGLPGENFGAPSPDGAIRAPLPKWMAYVWPAIALAWPEVAGVLERWERNVERLVLVSDGGPSTGGGSSAGHGVAGVHASHDLSAASGSSSSPFAPIPGAIGGFTSHVPGEALAYLAIVAILVAAFFVAVRYEIINRGGG